MRQQEICLPLQYRFNLKKDWNPPGIFSHIRREGNLTNLLFSYESVDKENFLNRF